LVISQSTGERGQEERDKVDGVRGKD
jgi:hypothetical protein